MPRKSTASTAATAGSDAHPRSPTTAAMAHDTSAMGDVSIVSTAGETSPKAKASRSKQDDTQGIDNFLLPRTLTSRLARGVLPANTSIQKDALLALTKSATVFISYLASHANELTSKKTISAQDVLKAIQEIEMADVMGLGAVGTDGRVGGRLERELEMYEDVVKGKRKGYREKVKARESDVGGLEEAEDDGDEPDSKRARMDEEGTNGTASSMPPPSHQSASLSTTMTNGQPPHSQSMNGSTSSHQRLNPSASDDELNSATPEEDPEPNDADETEPEDDAADDNEEDDDDEGDDERPEVDEYGPDDQLRNDMMNGAGGGGSEDESD